MARLGTSSFVLVLSITIFAPIVFEVMGIDEPEDRVVELDLTQEHLSGSMYWAGFMKGCFEDDPLLDVSVTFVFIDLRMELNLDKGLFTGTITGGSGQDEPSTGHFIGNIDGWVKRTEMWGSWYWVFEGRANLNLAFNRRKICKDSENNEWQIQEQKTLQIRAELSGDTYVCRDCISHFVISWEDQGGLEGGYRNFYLTCAHRDRQSGGCDSIPQKFPDPLDLEVTMTGPTIIHQGLNEATFSLEAKGKDLEMVKKVEWIFYYKDSVWEAQGNPDRWWSTEDIWREDLSDLHLSSITLVDWFELAYQYGSVDKDIVAMEMMAEVWAYDDQDRTLSLDRHSLASHKFAVKVEQNINWSDSYNIYPTQSNVTTLEIYFRDDDYPLELSYSGSLPPYLNVSFDPEIVEPPGPGGGSAFSKFNITLDCTKSPGINLPMDYKLMVTARTGDHEETKELALRLLPAKWLIMLYTGDDTSPPLSSAVVSNLYSIIQVTEFHGTPKIGIMLLQDSYFTNSASFFQVIDGNMKTVRNWGPTNMSDASTLKRFLKESMKRIPAERNHLILCGHGQGINGLIFDFHQGGCIKYPPLLSALASEFQEDKLDVLSFECCLMGEVEVVHHLRSPVHYFICSEQVIWTNSWAFDWYFSDLSKNPDMDTVQYVKILVDSPQHKTNKEMTFSAIDSSKLSNLASALNTLAEALSKGYKAHDTTYNSTITEIVEKSAKAGPKYPFVDIKDFAKKISSDTRIVDENIKKASIKVMNAVDGCVVANFVRIHDKQTGRPYASPPYHGLTIFLWPMGSSGKAIKGTYDSFVKHFKETAFASDTAWGQFVDDFVRSVHVNGTTITLEHPKKELYLHAYDEVARHVGFNPELINETMTPIDVEIPGAFYFDFRNGTEVVYLPANISSFRTVVGGYFMEEPEEPYSLTYELILNNEVVQTARLEKTIEANTNQETLIIVEGEELKVGETTIEGEVLPSWFRNYLPFLVPVASYLTRNLPSEVVMFVPYVTIGIFLLVIVLVGVVVRSIFRKKGEVAGDSG